MGMRHVPRSGGRLLLLLLFLLLAEVHPPTGGWPPGCYEGPPFSRLSRLSRLLSPPVFPPRPPRRPSLLLGRPGRLFCVHQRQRARRSLRSRRSCIADLACIDGSGGSPVPLLHPLRVEREARRHQGISSRRFNVPFRAPRVPIRLMIQIEFSSRGGRVFEGSLRIYARRILWAVRQKSLAKFDDLYRCFRGTRICWPCNGLCSELAGNYPLSTCCSCSCYMSALVFSADALHAQAAAESWRNRCRVGGLILLLGCVIELYNSLWVCIFW